MSEPVFDPAHDRARIPTGIERDRPRVGDRGARPGAPGRLRSALAFLPARAQAQAQAQAQARARARALVLMLVLVLAPAPSPAARASHPAVSSGIAAPALPSSLEGVSLDAPDGDTLVFRATDGSRLRVRIAGIDAPETSQPYAQASRRQLLSLLRERRIRIEPIKRDPYGRTVARVWVLDAEQPPRDAALALLQAGLAWHFTRYRADQTATEFARYARAEQAARKARIGLWRDDAPEPPWDFRARGRRDRGGTVPSAPPSRGG